VLGPLFVALVGLRINAGSPRLAAILVSLSFISASIRFLITQDRQDKATAELRGSRDLLEAVIEGTTEAVYARDLEGRYIFGNIATRRLLGCVDSGLVGRRDEEFFSPENARIIRDSDLQVINTGLPCVLDETFELNGRTHSFLAKKGPYKDAHGKVLGVLGIAVDVTERRKMEEELRKAQRMESIGTLAGGVAHDFNNILTVIKGYSQLLLEQTAGTPAHDQLAQIDSAADKAASLTRQLLAFSRKQLMQPKVLNLNKIVTDMQKMLRRMIGEDIDFCVELAEELLPILADPGQVEQVIMNLAANARDAMPRGGKLVISTANVDVDDKTSKLVAAEGHFVLLSVSDNGAGMDLQTQAHMFEPFFTTKPPGRGTGLGLSTVYGITRQSGGYIAVESEVGRGSTFKMYFPVANKPAEIEVRQPVIVQPKEGHETILIVEDEASLLMLIEASLRNKGYRVLVATSGEQAESVARHHEGPIHLLLTDVVMPQTSGRDLADRICERRPQTRVLWMSGYTDETIAHHGMLEPGLHFLQKPFTPAILGDKIREILDKR
jgi:PAS domain S-box-containing protein